MSLLLMFALHPQPKQLPQSQGKGNFSFIHLPQSALFKSQFATPTNFFVCNTAISRSNAFAKEPFNKWFSGERVPTQRKQPKQRNNVPKHGRPIFNVHAALNTEVSGDTLRRG